jgi:hypothetical protein
LNAGIPDAFQANATFQKWHAYRHAMPGAGKRNAQRARVFAHRIDYILAGFERRICLHQRNHRLGEEVGEGVTSLWVNCERPSTAFTSIGVDMTPMVCASALR